MTDVRTLSLAEIHCDARLQVRSSIQEDVVRRYMEILDDLPPVLVVETENGYLLADGFHRIEATGQAARHEIQAEVREGTRDDALLLAISENSSHGMPLTQQERREAVRRIYEMGKVTGGGRQGRKLVIKNDSCHAFLSPSRIGQITGLSERSVTRILAGMKVKKEIGETAPDLPDIHFERAARAPEERQAEVVQAASEQGWTEKETALVASMLGDERVTEEHKEAVLSGETPPIGMDESGQFYIIPDTPHRMIAQEKAGDFGGAFQRVMGQLGRLKMVGIDTIVAQWDREELEEQSRDLPHEVRFLEEMLTAINHELHRKLEVMR